MSEERTENGFDRLDRKIGMFYSRALACIFLIPAASFVGLMTLSSDDFSVTTHWPGLLASGGLFYLAKLCFRSRESMLSILSDVGTTPPKAK